MLICSSALFLLRDKWMIANFFKISFHIWKPVVTARDGPEECDFGHKKQSKKTKLDAIKTSLPSILIACLASPAAISWF